MEKFIDILTKEIVSIFDELGLESTNVRVCESNRPDLCEYQCNGSLMIAKKYNQKPIDIANKVVDKIELGKVFKKAEAVMPGFINLDIEPGFINNYISDMNKSEKFGYKPSQKNQTIIIDYGGANVAKPLHVGHLRTAVIGEALKRVLRFDGNKVIGDVHLGDWGLQMGLIIAQLQDEQPTLPYFDENYEGEYPNTPPFNISELEKIYPAASLRSKDDEEFKENAREITLQLQNGNRAYVALWQHILNVSIEDLKKNYDRLNVEFDLWKKESDAQPYIEEMVKEMKAGGYTRISDGALVVDVKKDNDTKEVPPCMVLKSNGATLYNTTDLATLVERRKLFDPDKIIYVVDKRQELYFEQVFRCAKKTKIVKPETELYFLGFGTMNGVDGKPFKTRSGGVMRLETLLNEIKEVIMEKMKSSNDIENIDDTAEKVALAAIKYGDLSNQATKDYIFDTERFASFDGETGPYILYTMVRIKSILKKADYKSFKITDHNNSDANNLLKTLTKLGEVLTEAVNDYAIHKLCKYAYEIANSFNSFYHSTKILTEKDEELRNTYISICDITLRILSLIVDLLGFDSPEKM